MKIASLLLTALVLLSLTVALGGCPSGKMMKGDISSPKAVENIG